LEACEQPENFLSYLCLTPGFGGLIEAINDEVFYNNSQNAQAPVEEQFSHYGNVASIMNVAGNIGCWINPIEIHSK